MGKRELLIILGFLVVGTVAFQVTAPPDTSTSSFSLGDFFRTARTEMRGNPGEGKFVHTASLPIPPGIREVRLVNVQRGVKIVGDTKDSVDYEFTVTSSGPDDAGAEELAKSTALIRDDVGDAMILRVEYPDPGSQRATILMHVPAWMAVRVEGTTGVSVSGVAAVHLEAIRGDVTLDQVTGAITGAHQDGDLTIGGGQSVRMRLLRSAARISKITDGLILDLRTADVEVSDSAGVLEVDETRTDLTVSDHKGDVTFRGTDGRLIVRRPSADVRVDVRRAEVEILMERAVPVTVITTDEPLRLILGDGLAFALDAAATGSEIQAADVDLKPEVSGADARLTHVFGGNDRIRVSLRNTRGDIVLRKNSSRPE